MTRRALVAILISMLLALGWASPPASARPVDGALDGSGHWVTMPATARDWYGAYHLGDVTAYCADLMSAPPRNASGWTQAPLDAPIPKQRGLARGGHLRYGHGPSTMSVTERAQVAWVLTSTGSSPTADVGAAVEHFVRLRTIDGGEQEERERVRWASVVKSNPLAKVEFDRLTVEATRYAGPYTATITWAKRPAPGDPTGRLMVEVRSAAGYSVPDIPVSWSASEALSVVRADTSTGATALAVVDVISELPGADPVEGGAHARVSGLPGVSPRVFLPTEPTVQRLLVAPSHTATTLTASTALAPRFTPAITTRTRDVVAVAGEPAVDIVTLRGGRPGAGFSGSTTLHGPFPSLAELRDAAPADRPVVGTATFSGRYDAQGSAEVASSALEFPGPGYYTWVERLAPAEFVTVPPAPAWPQPPETSIVISPTVTTLLSPGASGEVGIAVSDSLTLHGLPGRAVPDGTELSVSASGRLAGPVPPSSGDAGPTCEGVDWSAAPTVATYTDLPLSGDTLDGLLPATPTTAGCYSAEATVTISHASRADIVVEHPLGHPDQTILVTEQPAPVPGPTPEPTPSPTADPEPEPSPTPEPSQTPRPSGSAPPTRPGLPSTGR